jgi:hypothetical protein
MTIQTMANVESPVMSESTKIGVVVCGMVSVVLSQSQSYTPSGACHA